MVSQMNMDDLKNYYKQVFGKLKNGFQRSHYVLAAGNELIARGWDPNKLLVTVEPVDHLENLTVNQGLEVFIPIVNSKNVDGSVKRPEALLWPFDFEIYLQDNYKLYCDPKSQLHFFKEHIGPVKDHLVHLLEDKKIPHVLDYTPSGGHILTYVLRDTDGWNALKRIGYEDSKLIESCMFHDPSDVKRSPPMDYDTTMAYSGLCIITEYLALKTKQDVRPREDLPITLWDSQEKSVNLDISWTADPAFMRIIRAPFSAHKKKAQKYHIGPQPMVDVMGRFYDGQGPANSCDDLDWVVNCMWNFDAAIEHSKYHTGYIPFANEGIVRLVEEYESSPLKKFHDYCHYGENDLAPGEATHRALNDSSLSDKTKSVVANPNPRMLRPIDMRLFVHNLRDNFWHPKHIKCLMTDKYRENHGWSMNFFKYSPEKKAWAFARQYASGHKIKTDSNFRL